MIKKFNFLLEGLMPSFEDLDKMKSWKENDKYKIVRYEDEDNDEKYVYFLLDKDSKKIESYSVTGVAELSKFKKMK